MRIERDFRQLGWPRAGIGRDVGHVDRMIQILRIHLEIKGSNLIFEHKERSAVFFFQMAIVAFRIVDDEIAKDKGYRSGIDR